MHGLLHGLPGHAVITVITLLQPGSKYTWVCLWAGCARLPGSAAELMHQPEGMNSFHWLLQSS